MFINLYSYKHFSYFNVFYILSLHNGKTGKMGNFIYKYMILIGFLFSRYFPHRKIKENKKGALIAPFDFRLYLPATW